MSVFVPDPGMSLGLGVMVRTVTENGIAANNGVKLGDEIYQVCTHPHTITISHHTITLSHHHNLAPSHHHTITILHDHTITLSHHHTITLSHHHTSHHHNLAPSHHHTTQHIPSHNHIHTVTPSHYPIDWKLFALKNFFWYYNEIKKKKHFQRRASA